MIPVPFRRCTDNPHRYKSPCATTSMSAYDPPASPTHIDKDCDSVPHPDDETSNESHTDRLRGLLDRFVSRQTNSSVRSSGPTEIRHFWEILFEASSDTGDLELVGTTAQDSSQRPLRPPKPVLDFARALSASQEIIPSTRQECPSSYAFEKAGALATTFDPERRYALSVDEVCDEPGYEDMIKRQIIVTLSTTSAWEI